MRTLHERFFVLVAGLVCAVGALAFLLQARTLRTYEMAMTQALNGEVAATLARELEQAGGSVGRDGTAAIKTQLHRLMAINPSAEIYVLDAAGRVLVSTADDGQVLQPVVDVRPLEAFIARRSALPVTARDPREPGAERIFSAALLGNGPQASGFVYVVLGGAETEAAARRIQTGVLIRSTLTLIGLGLVVALLTGFVVMATLTRKLRRLTAEMERFGQTKFRDAREVPTAAAPRGDEIDRLGRAYNDMSGHILQQMEQIARQHATRQELIASVSHDLRTPLTALRGYLDTLRLQESALSAEARRTYVEIAARQTGTMERLVSELFDLATLEDLDRPLVAENFHLSELVQDVLQKFELIAAEKGIVLRGRYMPDAPLIPADIALIERLLDNLLENALRHTPPGGHVDLGVTTAGTHVVLEVRDTGRGIAARDLAALFERPRRANADGTGLGLVIVKRIVELHHGTISVSSEEGAGATFRVEFPRAP